MRSPRVLAGRARGLVGLDRVVDLERRVDELAIATEENAHLDSLLEVQLEELERAVVEVAVRRLPPRTTAWPDSP